MILYFYLYPSIGIGRMLALGKSVDSLPALAAFQTNGKLKISPEKATTEEKKSQNHDTIGPVKLIWVTRVITAGLHKLRDVLLS